ncbi:TonB-dependent receptor [Flavobacterium jejuense]|uniref:TonB-dependent receptor n=1 Tax=Flavobacterium jejuense TaxID=1544455 RepID=A0ABX0IMR2_9FLAO|nr:TonB-dependent receptor [Flavobacterium jejuense]NHN24876.1 TonB-dependent receptor [Flavobacterium jejuense]
MKKINLIIVICIFNIFGALAQTKVKGIVVSKADGFPIASATIIPNGKVIKGASTDFDGKFELDLSLENGTIKITYLGYKELVVSYSGNQTLNIVLEEETNSLEEVVLIGYGSSKKGDITTAISKIEDIKSIASRPVNNTADFLQGRSPGVTVLSEGGDPNATPKIVIRGIGSLSSNEAPLTVVDGVPYYGPAINPNDIASISILKDAASASIYGAQAASGVIVIETKKGRIGKPQISFDSFTAFQTATNLPTPLNAQQQNDVYNLAADNGGTPRQDTFNSAVNTWGQTTRTNWIDEVFRTAPMYNGNLNISGATDHVNYMTSFGYNKKEGVLIGNNFERYSFRVKTDVKLTDKVTVGENVYFSRSAANGFAETSGNTQGVITNAMQFPSAAPVYDSDGNFSGTVPSDRPDLLTYAGAYGDIYNPVALLIRPTTASPTSYLKANTFLKYNIIEGLNFTTTYSYGLTNENYKRFKPRIPEIGRTNTQNSLTQSNATTNRWIWDNQLSYVKSFGNHNINATAIYSAQKTNYESFGAVGYDFDNESNFNQYLGNASNTSHAAELSSSVYKDALTSAIGRVMYNYKNKYFLTGSIRRDQSSRLAKENQVGYFPSVSAGWSISEEDFFKVDKVNNLKIRASWGQIGNINSVGYYSFDVPLGSRQVIINSNGDLNAQGIYLSQLSNTNLTWETSESYDLGLDATLFDQKLALTVDYFKKTTKGMILPGLEDSHQGADAPYVNAGKVDNTGLEFSATYTDAIGKLNYSISANASTLKNKLINLDGYNNTGIDYVAHNDNYRDVLLPFRSQIGEQLFSNYLVPYLGIFQSQAEIDAYTKDGNLIQPNAVPGDFKFADTNNDGKIDVKDKKSMGSYLPKVTYNFSLNLDYKGFDLGLIFQGVGKVNVFNASKYTFYNAGNGGYNLESGVLSAWTPTNTNTDIPRVSTADPNNNFQTNSSWYLENGAYLRVKNITLGYTLPENIFRGTSLRLYISAENLFAFTNYSGLNPEVGGRGLDLAKYPVPRVISTGLSVKL